MSSTRTGSLPISFRIGSSPWQQELSRVIHFASSHGFAGLDPGPIEIAQLKKIPDAGLRIGSVDLPQPWSDLMSTDQPKRQEAVARCATYVRDAVAAGARNFFAVMIPQDATRQRRENLALAADGYGALCEAIASTGAKIVLEGWPGGSPRFASLACTPADYRLVFDRVGSHVLGVNFDPSHLIRMGIDPVRFLAEFAHRIHHVHAKDTELFAEDLYQHGNLQPATESEPHGWGGHHWRYAIPGHGVAPWGRLLSILSNSGYGGMLGIELEDENFNGTTEGEQRGLIAAKEFLMNV